MPRSVGYHGTALVETVREPSAWCMEALCTGTGEEGICVGVLHLCIRDASVYVMRICPWLDLVLYLGLLPLVPPVLGLRPRK